MLERRIAITALVFLLALTAVIGLSVRLFGIGLPTCLTDVKPFTTGQVVEQAPKRYEIHYVARMWKFDPPEISIVPGSTADIYLATADVTHGVQIVGTNFDLMAVPGAVNYARVKFDKAGDYLVVCNEYCGTAHHNMAGMIHVTTKAAAPPPVPPHAEDTEASEAAVVEKYGCTACHSIDGSAQIGPTFKGLYGSKRVLANGQTVVADEAYIRESIENPGAKVVKGFEPNMPSMSIPPNELHEIIEYIERLK
jgi:cytochrome c oxidase subunit II